MLTQKRLKEVLSYNHETGVFIWLYRRRGPIAKGSMAGTTTVYGYRTIGVDSIVYQAGRLAWLYMTGKWPKVFIDHINLDRSDNRFSNLRECTVSQNNSNNRGWGKSGVKGVRPCNGRWQARITVKNKERHLGLFDTPEEASKAYKAAAEKFFGTFHRA